MTKTYKDFEDFYTHPFIKSIENNEKWTVSDCNKKPIDMFGLHYQKHIYGAVFTDYCALVSLPELCKILPNAANNAYYMDAMTDRFVLLDIEPKCPEDIKEKLLEMAYIYGEISMSGKGLHLVFPLPDCINDFPIVQKKIVMKEKHGYYEILLNHYVTFTRNQIEESKNKNQDSFIELFKSMAAMQKESKKAEIDIESIASDEIPNKNYIVDLLKNQKYKKTIEDFSDDASVYEYGHIGFLNYKLKQILEISSIKDAHEYTQNEKAWLLYIVARDSMEYRPKWDEQRNNLPWLLYLCEDIISRDICKS